MTKKRKPINSFGQDLNDGILRVNPFSFKDDPYFLVNIILKHKRDASCKDCQWTITILEKEDSTEFDTTDKNCILKIAIEYMLVGSAVKILVKDHGFIENPKFVPTGPIMSVMIFVYCS